MTLMTENTLEAKGMRILFPILFVLLLTIAILPMVSADPIPGSQMKCWTDRPTYRIGEEVTIYVSIQGKPQPGEAGSGFTLSISRPDGSHSEIELGDLTDGVYSSPGTVGPPPGTRDVSLFWHVAPGKIGLAMVATCSFEVIGGPADLEVGGVWVSPSNPHQEDMVSFSAEIANIGGTDANGFLIQVYLDGNLWDSGSFSLAAGSDNTFTSDRQYQAEDGQHNVRCVVNSDQRVQESDYSNNEGSANFFVSPRTVTLTEYVTVTNTRTQTKRETLTITTTRTLTRTLTTDTTATSTLTASPVVMTSTLTGLVTSTVYSPTVTTTVTAAAQMISNPVLWLILSTFGMMGAMFQLPKGGRLRKFCRRVATIFPVPELLAWLTKPQPRKALFAVCLISVIILSITFQASQSAYASTVTSTRTLTSTEWTTLTQSLTSTHYITSMATETLTFTRTSTKLMTSTQTSTMTVDRRSTSTTYLPTYVTVTTTTSSAAYGITSVSRVYYDPFRRNILDVTGTVAMNGNQFDAQLRLKNTRGGFYQVRVYHGPVYFTPESLAYSNLLWPDQVVYPVKVETPEIKGGGQICIDVELDLTMETVKFIVGLLPIPAPNPLSYGEQYVWLKSELLSHMKQNGYLPSDYESKPDGVQFLRAFSSLCSKESDYVLQTFSEFGAKCYITFEKEGLGQAIKDFASQWSLPFKLAEWDYHVWTTPATEIIYANIGRVSSSGAG